MKVYILFLKNIGWHFSISTEVLGTYSSEKSVKEELVKIKTNFLARGPGFKTEDHKDGRGFTAYHEVGSMSFIPSSYYYEEQEVKD